MGRYPLKSEVIIKLIEEHPDWSKKKIGEVAHARRPDLFPTAEIGRNNVRAVTGSHGQWSREKGRTTTNKWTGALPRPEKNDFSRVQLPAGRIGLLQDIHLPYYDEEALDVAIGHLMDFRPDTIVLNGDIMDCYHVSNFVKDPTERDMEYELETLRKFLTQIQHTFVNKAIIYKLGNHEERWERFILTQAPALFKIEAFKFEEVVCFGNAHLSRIQFVKNKRIIEAGHLHIVHGHEFGRNVFSPVNPARGFFLRSKTNVIGGHYHQTSEHMEQDLSGKVIGAWSTGCLSELSPKYMPINKWNHGFATVDLDSDGSFEVRNRKIIDGRIR